MSNLVDSLKYLTKLESIFSHLIEEAEGPPFVPLYLSSDNYMITLCYAHTLIEYASNNEVSEPLKKIIDALKDDSNPVAVLVKLK